MASWFSLFRSLLLVNVSNFSIKRLCASIDAEAEDTPFLKKSKQLSLRPSAMRKAGKQAREQSMAARAFWNNTTD
jgi:hypothetical protein